MMMLVVDDYDYDGDDNDGDDDNKDDGGDDDILLWKYYLVSHSITTAKKVTYKTLL